MIKKLLGLLGLFSFLAVTPACSDIDSDNRLIEVEAATAVRNVVIEDFTGQNCINCPDAHAVLEALVEQYGAEHVIPVSIHAGSFGMSTSMTNYDRGLVCLMQPEGNQLQNVYGEVNSWPIGVIDGRGGFVSHDTWAQLVRVELERPSEAAVKISASYDEAANKAIIKTVVTPYADLDATLKIWVLESSIIARQRNAEGLVPDYRHDNVWRATVTPLEGEAVTLTDGSEATFSHSIELRNMEKERWVAENLSFVAILATPDGYVNAARCSLATGK